MHYQTLLKPKKKKKRVGINSLFRDYKNNPPKNVKNVKKKPIVQRVWLDIISIISGVIRFACEMEYNTSCSYIIPYIQIYCTGIK